MTKGVLLSLILIFAWVFLHMVVVRIFRPKRIFMTSTRMFWGTIPLFLGGYLATPSDLYVLPESLSQTPAFLGLLNGLIIHFLLYGAWWQVFYPIERALTLGILIEYLKPADGYLDNREIQARYSFESSIEKRLEDMLLNGYVHAPDASGRYKLTARGDRLTRFFIFCRRIFRVPFYLLDERRK